MITNKCLALLLGMVLVLAQQAMAINIFDAALDEIRSLASDSQSLKDQFESAAERLRQTNLNDYLQQGYEKFNELMKSVETTERPLTPLEKDRRSLKFFLEALGEKRFGEDGKTLNEKATELLIRLKPDLCGTDFTADPAKCTYYFLAIDPGGFIENVKLVRGPMGAPMTLREAYEYYYRSDPQKAARILILLETLQKIGAPNTDESQLEIILKAVKTNLELINQDSGQQNSGQ
jgi:hypothetical protein